VSRGFVHQVAIILVELADSLADVEDVDVPPEAGLLGISIG